MAQELQHQASVQTVEGKPVWLYQAPFLFAEHKSKIKQASSKNKKE
jgi:hypothetical protein